MAAQKTMPPGAGGEPFKSQRECLRWLALVDLVRNPSDVVSIPNCNGNHTALYLTTFMSWATSHPAGLLPLLLACYLAHYYYTVNSIVETEKLTDMPLYKQPMVPVLGLGLHATTTHHTTSIYLGATQVSHATRETAVASLEPPLLGFITIEWCID